MDPRHVRQLAERLIRGDLALESFVDELARPATADLEEAQIDLDRRRRCGYPEVVFGHGKTVATLEKILQALVADGVDVLATRISAEQAAGLAGRFPTARYNPTGKTLRIPLPESPGTSAATQPGGHVTIITAGTSDLAVAEEARETLLWMGAAVTLVCDVGVAGPHRLREQLHKFEQADAVVVIAGMEGPAQRGGRLRGLPGDRGADQRGLRRQLRRGLGALEHAEQLRRQRGGGQHRRRIQGSLRGRPDRTAKSRRRRLSMSACPAGRARQIFRHGPLVVRLRTQARAKSCKSGTPLDARRQPRDTSCRPPPGQPWADAAWSRGAPEVDIAGAISSVG